MSMIVFIALHCSSLIGEKEGSFVTCAVSDSVDSMMGVALPFSWGVAMLEASSTLDTTTCTSPGAPHALDASRSSCWHVSA